MSWSGMLYYGETFGFVFAWVAGVAALVATSTDQRSTQPAVDQVAVAEIAPSSMEDRETVLGVR